MLLTVTFCCLIVRHSVFVCVCVCVCACLYLHACAHACTRGCLVIECLLLSFLLSLYVYLFWGFDGMLLCLLVLLARPKAQQWPSICMAAGPRRRPLIEVFAGGGEPTISKKRGPTPGRLQNKSVCVCVSVYVFVSVCLCVCVCLGDCVHAFQGWRWMSI